MALSGTTAFIGAPNAYALTVSPARGCGLRVHRVDGAVVRAGELELPGLPGRSGFGASVALSGATALIGSPGRRPRRPAGAAGAAYVFTGSGGTWAEEAELVDPDPSPTANFGCSVAVSGQTAVVGAEGSGTGGAAYVYTESGGTWAEQARLLPSDGAQSSFYGYSVALAGSTALVGAPAGAGGAYVFTESGGAWLEQQKLAPLGGPLEAFGLSVAVSGTAALVGSPYGDDGSAYLFTESDGAWSQRADLANPTGDKTHFGYSVALAGTTGVIGAEGNPDTNGADADGAAYAYWR